MHKGEFGVSRRSPASIDRQNTQSEIGGSGKSTPSWQRSEDSIADQMALVREEIFHFESDSHYSSHSSSNTLSSNASSAHSDEKWCDGDRAESELNSYNYLQGTSADSGIDTTSYGPSHGSTASLGAATSSPRSGPAKEKVAPLWHSSSEVISMADRTLEAESHGMDRKAESSLSLDIHTKSQAGSNPLTRENSAFSINDAASHARRHQSDGNEIAHTRLRASTRDLRASPKPTSKSTIEEELKKLIDLESPTPESQKNFKGQRAAETSSRPAWFQAPSRCIRRQGEFSASDSSLTDVQETRRPPMPDPGLMPLPDAAADLDWSNLVDAAKAYEVQRASFFAASDENHRPLSAASNSDQLEDQALAQMKSYSSSKDSSPTLASKVDQLEGMLKMLREDLKKEKEDKAHLQAEVEHLREDNLRLQEESQNASDKLKKFTEWVFNTIDMS
ncbi:Signal-induced proliferation-associated 1-like protein 1 [Camelus dromedarius]|uniref:Signal-induced proliferation-associated 1-like protein 1 n=1 Tax=Camelus dromedarius TaxID=9838 RepID=A0A5N4E1S0_CAMDR|nr:Signal-induced proliferation-associated 1-like protein 1 [Camelus dromedarius]